MENVKKSKSTHHRGETVLLSLLRSFRTVLLFPFAFFLRFIAAIFCLRFGVLVYERIGHFALNTEIYFSRIDIENNISKYIDIFFCSRDVCNIYLLQMWRRTFAKYEKCKLYILPLPFLKIIKILIAIGRDIAFQKDVFEISTTKTSYPIGIRDAFLLDLCSPHINFLKNEYDAGRRQLNEMGVPENASFVCFHVRDSAYLNTCHGRFLDFFQRVDYSYDEYRNSSVVDLMLALEELTRRGYYLIRMGAVVSEQIKTKNPMIIDYACSEFRTDFMDIFLSAHCSFFLGTVTGLSAVPHIFKRPVLYVNDIPILDRPGFSGTADMFIPKKIKFLKDMSYLTFREMLALGNTGVSMNYKKHEELGVCVKNNTAQEILSVAIEMEERLRGVWRTTAEDEVLQSRFWSLFEDSHLRNPIRIRIGRDFLRENMALLN